MRYSTRSLRPHWLPLLGAFFLLVGPGARAEDNSSQVSQAQEQLKTEHFAEALASATEAVRLNPDDYRGHYYVAMASMVLGKFDEAEAAVARAQTLAPDNAKATIDKLRATIATNRQGEDKATAADTALAEGLLAKAARLYREAWSAKHDKPDLAFKAADLYANRLDDPVAAAILWREVVAVAQGTQEADKAQVQLDKWADALTKIAWKKYGQIQDASTRTWDDEVRLLAEALAADPNNKWICQQKAILGSRSSHLAFFESGIKDLARVGLTSEADLLKLPGLPEWLNNSEFSAFLSDVIGADKVAHLKTTIAQQQAEARSAEAKRLADEQARKIAEAKLKADQLPRPDFTNTYLRAGMVGLPGGDFLRENGSRVTITKSFWLGQCEITQSQYEGTMGTNPSLYRRDGFPVEDVSWKDAMAFCRKVTEHERAAGHLPDGYVYTLPTEAQWEYACRAGTTGDFAGNPDEMGWYEGNSGGSHHVISGKKPNKWGLYDMHGNVGEWCLDWHAAYPEGNVRDPAGPDAGIARIVRGGGYSFPVSANGSATRDWQPPDFKDPSLGFRIALVPVR